jgi:hypothetical protein
MALKIPRGVLPVLLAGLGLSFAATPAHAWFLFKRGGYYQTHPHYTGYNPPVTYPSGVYTGYAGSDFYFRKPIFGYHWANPTMYSTGVTDPGVPGFEGVETEQTRLPTKDDDTRLASVSTSTSGYTPRPIGLTIVEVKDGTAKQAGVQAGAVITALNGVKVYAIEDLPAALQTSLDTVTLTLREPSGRTYTQDVHVQASKIGVIVEEMPLER